MSGDLNFSLHPNEFGFNFFSYVLFIFYFFFLDNFFCILLNFLVFMMCILEHEPLRVFKLAGSPGSLCSVWALLYLFYWVGKKTVSNF